LKAADSFDDVNFAHTFDAAMKTGESHIVLFKDFDEKISNFEGELSKESIVSFIESNYLPTVMGFD